MKYKVLIPFCLLLFVALSWFSLFKGQVSDTSSYKDLVKKAEESFEKELYQQAYGYYEEAFAVKSSKELEDKIIECYKTFDQEQDTTDTFTAYLETINKACQLFPNEEAYWEEAIRTNLEGAKYEAAMDLCKKAEQEKVKSDELEKLEKQVLYSYATGGYACSGFKNEVNGFFITTTGIQNARLSSDAEEYEFMDDIEVGYVGENGIYLGKDPENRIRFIDLQGIIRGKVDLDISEFGVYAEGFCPVKYNESYCYIDLDGNILVDNLMYAGCFQNGKAVIQDAEGKWALIDTSGKVCSQYFDEIKVDYAGRYLFGDNIIVKQDETYKLYNKSLKKEVKNLNATEIDIPVLEGFVAYAADGKWGFVDSKGKVVIEPQYEKAKSFSGGLAAVSENEKWGLINVDNEVVVPYQYYDIGYVSDDGVCYVSDTVDYYQIIHFNFSKEFNQ